MSRAISRAKLKTRRDRSPPRNFIRPYRAASILLSLEVRECQERGFCKIQTREVVQDRYQASEIIMMKFGVRVAEWLARDRGGLREAEAEGERQLSPEVGRGMERAGRG